MTSEILSQLNEQQREAVEYIGGPSLVIAGAGSGKTRVLTHKIAYLLQGKELDMEPWNILALTFTNKAAAEMRERVARLVGEERAKYLYMGTFHSVFARILRKEAPRLAYRSNYTIYDDSDSRSLIKSIVKEMGLNDKQYKPSSVLSRISMAKNHLLLPKKYLASAAARQRDEDAKMPEFSRIYETYCERCKAANAMDFDDLLVNTWLLFEEHQDVLEKYAKQFRYILVDEYQDTNTVQDKILRLLVSRQDVPRLCAVGDDAQSIYGFRGAKIDNILNFQKNYPEPVALFLIRNYRSTKPIIEAAESLLKHNREQVKGREDIDTQKNQEGEKLQVRSAYSDREEAMIVCKEIRRRRLSGNMGYGDFAVLYRTNSQSRSFEEAFRKEGIPYKIYGGMSFYDRKEVKDVIAYLRLVVNPDDEEALKRIINYPARGIGNTTLQKIGDLALQHHVSWWEVISDVGKFGLNVNRSTLARIEAFRALIDRFLQQSRQVDVYELGELIVKDSGIWAEFANSTDIEDKARQENIGELLSAMHDFADSKREEGEEGAATLEMFLQEVSLASDVDGYDDAEDFVRLMTIHSAKGLEFPAVFVVGMEENLFPSPMSVFSSRELEEERRLLYVAITRAEKFCYLTYAKSRYRYGQVEVNEPSRFLRDIDPRYLDSDDKSILSLSARTAAIQQPAARPLPSRHLGSGFEVQKLRASVLEQGSGRFSRVDMARRGAAASQVTLVTEGQTIEHERFGIGQVISVEGVGENTKATVAFKNVGTKQLLVKFARFKIID